MMAFLQYAMQVVFSFLMMSMMFIFLPRASVSGGRIADVLAVKPTIVDPKQPKPFDPKNERLGRIQECFLPLSECRRKCDLRHQLHRQTG